MDVAVSDHEAMPMPTRSTRLIVCVNVLQSFSWPFSLTKENSAQISTASATSYPLHFYSTTVLHSLGLEPMDAAESSDEPLHSQTCAVYKPVLLEHIVVYSSKLLYVMACCISSQDH